MKRATAVLSGILLCIALVAAGPADALVGGPRYPAPDFSCPIWINSKPLTLKQLRGKVVLVDFWDYTCINCIRTFPHLKRWQRLYGPLGLTIIAVHTPEFDFAKNPALVKAAVRRFGLGFAVAVDSDGKIWDAFHNGGWPTDYLIDKNGRVVDKHLGEGDYDLMEIEIQHLLKEANPSLDFSAARYRVPEDQPLFGGACMRTTPETYLGTLRFMNISNHGGLVGGKPVAYKAPKSVPPDTAALEGSWTAGPDAVHSVASADGVHSTVELHYRAKSVYVVAGADKGTSAWLYVTQDGKSLTRDLRGRDVESDWLGNTYIAIGQRRMYYVVKNPHFGEHNLRLSTTNPGVGVYSFTFGNNCEPSFAQK